MNVDPKMIRKRWPELYFKISLNQRYHSTDQAEIFQAFLIAHLFLLIYYTIFDSYKAGGESTVR